MTANDTDVTTNFRPLISKKKTITKITIGNNNRDKFNDCSTDGDDKYYHDCNTDYHNCKGNDYCASKW